MRKIDRPATPHRNSDVAVASLLGILLVASVPLMPILADTFATMARQVADLPAYRALILGVAP